MDYQKAGHISLTPEDIRENINRALSVIQDSSSDSAFDVIAFRGMSGAMVAVPVALQLDKELILVRKDGETRYSPHLVEGPITERRVLIIDDFVFTGNTARAIVHAIAALNPDHEIIGIVEYAAPRVGLKYTLGCTRITGKAGDISKTLLNVKYCEDCRR